MSTIPVLGLFLAAVVMAVSTLIQVVSVTVEVVYGTIDMQSMLVEYIECADFFLLAIVLYIMSVGLYSLFIDDKINLPVWLEIHTLDDLKEKLVSVIVVVMGVFFLGRLIHGAEAQDLLFMGAGIGAVVLSLAYFVHHVMTPHGESGSLVKHAVHAEHDIADSQTETDNDSALTAARTTDKSNKSIS